MARELKIGGVIFTQPQIMLLFKCHPYLDSDDLKENTHQIIPGLIANGTLEEFAYDSGEVYYEPTELGAKIIKEYRPRG